MPSVLYNKYKYNKWYQYHIKNINKLQWILILSKFNHFQGVNFVSQIKRINIENIDGHTADLDSAHPYHVESTLRLLLTQNALTITLLWKCDPTNRPPIHRRCHKIKVVFSFICKWKSQPPILHPYSPNSLDS